MAAFNPLIQTVHCFESALKIFLRHGVRTASPSGFAQVDQPPYHHVVPPRLSDMHTHHTKPTTSEVM